MTIPRMGDADFSSSQFSLWVPLSRALELIAAKSGNSAYAEIVRRLANGLLEARAQDSFVEMDGRKVKAPQFAKVPQSVWKEVLEEEYLYANPMWQTNTAMAEVGGNYSRHSSGTKYEFFGVRIGPDGLESMGIITPRVAMATAQSEPTSAPTQEKPIAESEQKGPPISDAALAAWYEAYKLAYPGAADTEAKAMESAKGCFPGKSFSRDKVRDLRGTRTRGRKPKTAK